jgi:carbamoyl-phosphate synthase small subunit
MPAKAILILEDGTVFQGYNFGVSGEAYGEVVFNTSMTGYQEILTDPSYKGQIVTMTYPHIGNYGVNEIEDIESDGPCVEGFIVKECSKIYSNWRATDSLDKYLKKHNIIGIEGIDTRRLTKHLRVYGAMKGYISTIDFDIKSLLKKVKSSPSIIGRDLVKEVATKQKYLWCGGKKELNFPEKTLYDNSSAELKVVVIDCGVKYSILRCLESNGVKRIVVVPPTTTCEEILTFSPHGILLSNGPGDPEGVPYVIETVRKLIEHNEKAKNPIPIFGICLGQQILALAYGGKTYKLKFGHRGANHPVKNLSTGKIEITVQNHGFCVDIKSLPKEIEVTHINLNDYTLEGIRHKKLPIFSVQYHPEASAGPHDSRYLFNEFVNMMRESL